jgi:quinoprotein relay system zinc metallohydrolase 2
MISLRIAGLALALTAVAGAASGKEDIAALPVREIASGVYVYEAPVSLAAPSNEGAIANLGFIIGQDSVAVVDTGGSLAAGRRFLAAIRKQTSLPIRYVINTHMHPDHVLGNAAFLETGARFVGHHQLPTALGARLPFYLSSNRALIGSAFEGTSGVLPTVLVERTLDLDLGRRILRVEAWPTAHTNTDLTVRDLATDTWFLGDLLFSHHVPTIDGKLTGWRKTLQSLVSRAATRVVPGHGPGSMPWPSAATPMERYLAQLEADVRAMIREGRTLRETADLAGQTEKRNWTLFDDFNARNATTAYQELEWND